VGHDRAVCRGRAADEEWVFNLDGTLQWLDEAICATQACATGSALASYTYDGSGRLSSMVSQIYSSDNNLVSSSTVFANPTYNAIGAVTSAQLALDPASQIPGISLIRSYDNRLRLTGETDTNDQLSPLYNYSGGWPRSRV